MESWQEGDIVSRKVSGNHGCMGVSVQPGSCVPSAHAPYMVGCLLGAILIEDMRKSEQGAGFHPQLSASQRASDFFVGSCFGD